MELVASQFSRLWSKLSPEHISRQAGLGAQGRMALEQVSPAAALPAAPRLVSPAGAPQLHTHLPCDLYPPSLLCTTLQSIC